MKVIVTTLTLCLLILNISGCAKKEIVIQRCEIPAVVKKPDIDTQRHDAILENAKQCLSNYVKMRDYAQNLEEAIAVCR